MARADFVIVQEAYAGAETLAHADLVLPAATWPEKSGTMTNPERRISRVRAAIAPPGDAMPDWRLAQAVALRLAARIAPRKAALFGYRDESEVYAEHARMTAGRDLDYSALDYPTLERDGRSSGRIARGRAGRACMAMDAIPRRTGAPVSMTWATGRPSNPCRRTTRSS